MRRIDPGLCYNFAVESDSPTEEALYGDLDVTRENGGAGGAFQVLFRPVGTYATPSGAGHVLLSREALETFLRDLGLSNDQVSALICEDGGGRWLRVLAATAVLKRHGLI